MKFASTTSMCSPLMESYVGTCLSRCSSITEKAPVCLGKTPRELHLFYLRKMPPHLQKEIRIDKRLWRGESVFRGPSTWEEAHRVVLEYEKREATYRAAANSVFATRAPEVGDPRPKKKD